MVHYKDIFLKSRGYEKGNRLGCEICGTTAVHIHHISQSMRGTRKCKADGSDLIYL